MSEEWSVKPGDMGKAIKTIAVACVQFHPTIAYAAMHGLMTVIKDSTPEHVPNAEILSGVEQACRNVMGRLSGST